MLAKKYRLKKKKDFEAVLKTGKAYSAGPLFLKIAENKLGNSRFGIIIGRKVIAKAVKRNLIKRRIRAVVYGLMSRFKKNVDVIILVKGLDKELSFWEIKGALEQVFLKAELL